MLYLNKTRRLHVGRVNVAVEQLGRNRSWKSLGLGMRRLKGVTDGVVGVKSTPVPGVGGAGAGACGLEVCIWVGLGCLVLVGRGVWGVSERTKREGGSDGG